MKPIISNHNRIRHADLFSVGPYSIVDDFSYFSTKVVIGVCSHVASNCTIAGGKDFTFRMGDFSSVSAGVRIWCTSDDFVNDLVTVLPPGCPPLKKNLMQGDVTLENYTAIGTNSVLMPGITVPEGTVIGALSFVPFGTHLDPWFVYAGNPVRKIKPRNSSQVLAQVEQLKNHLKIK